MIYSDPLELRGRARHAQARVNRVPEPGEGTIIFQPPLESPRPPLVRKIEHLERLTLHIEYKLEKLVVRMALQRTEPPAAPPTARAPLPTPTPGAVPAWFLHDISCVSDHEEYGLSGSNTSAGYFGFAAGPPSVYVEPGPTYAREYGDSWLDIPQSAQVQIAYAVYRAYGWSPWTTAGACGL